MNSNSTILRNFSFLAASNIFVQVIRFITVMCLTRNLGVAQFGLYSFAILLLSYGSVVVEFGFKNLGLREFSQGRGSWDFIFKTVGIRFVLSLAAVLVTGLLLWKTFGLEATESVLWILLSVIPISLSLDYVLASQERMAPMALRDLMQSLIFMVAVIRDGTSLAIIAFSYLISQCVALAFIYIPIFKFSLKEAHYSSGQLLREGFPLFLVALLGLAHFSMDQFVLGNTASQDYLGYYSGALKVLSVGLGLIYSLMAAIHPRLAKYSANLESTEMKTILHHLFVTVLFILVPVSVLFFLRGDYICELLLGEKFINSGQILGPLSLAIMLHALALGPMHALSVRLDVKLLNRILALNLVIGYFALSGGIFVFGEVATPWVMIFVQSLYLVGGWYLMGYSPAFNLENSKILGLSIAGAVAVLIVCGSVPSLGIILAIFTYLTSSWFWGLGKTDWFVFFIGGNRPA